ncbi:MAG: TIGR01440 family protein [Clostridia bacterium]|nr:TIGR01440 family protein [Clostridia bacterium]
MSDYYSEALKAFNELIISAGLKSGDFAVIGCSTSEIAGKRIGTAGTTEIAGEIVKAIKDSFLSQGINIAAQCCEHLNRALVIEKEVADRYGYEQVSAVPYPHAGGSFATEVYRSMNNPVLVEEIIADAGIDIGNTLIGMHIKRVAVPLRLENNVIGFAHINAAKSRPKLIGGERAKYK